MPIIALLTWIVLNLGDQPRHGPHECMRCEMGEGGRLSVFSQYPDSPYSPWFLSRCQVFGAAPHIPSVEWPPEYKR
jgi:hypothetical protein